MIIIQISFLILQTVLAFTKPKYFLYLYFLFTSSFLGFFPKDILIEERDIGLYYQSILLIIPYLLNYQKNSLPKYIRISLDLLIIVYIYGVLQPLFVGNSSILQSITESKNFSTLFLTHYLFSNRKHFSTEYINKLIYFFGYYFTFILLLFLVDIIPPFYVKNEDRDIEFYYPTILSLFVIIKAGKAKSLKQKVEAFFLILIWAVGMSKEGHAAIMLTTTMSSLIILFRIPIIVFVEKFSYLLLGIVLALTLLYILPTEKIIDELTNDPSITSRDTYNKLRMEFIKERPLMGYGFMHKTAMEVDSSTIYTESLSFIDTGYIDLLGKFGYIGTVFYLSILIFLFFRKNIDARSVNMRVYFLQLCPVNITWSVFSFSVGLLALGLAIYLYNMPSKKIYT